MVKRWKWRLFVLALVAFVVATMVLAVLYAIANVSLCSSRNITGLPMINEVGATLLVTRLGNPRTFVGW